MGLPFIHLEALLSIQNCSKTRMHSSRMRTRGGGRNWKKILGPPENLENSPPQKFGEHPPQKIWRNHPPPNLEEPPLPKNLRETANLETLPVDRILDTRFWKYYLGPTSLRPVTIRYFHLSLNLARYSERVTSAMVGTAHFLYSDDRAHSIYRKYRSGVHPVSCS